MKVSNQKKAIWMELKYDEGSILRILLLATISYNPDLDKGIIMNHNLWSVDNFPSNKLIRSLAKPGLIMKEDKISNEIFCIILQSVILQIYLGNENIKYQWNPIDSLQDNCKLNNRLCDFIFFQVNKELSISPLCNLLMASVLQFLNFSV